MVSNTIDMQDMRRLNLFSKITKIGTNFCFSYNRIIFFCVPKKLIRKAVGENGKNIKKMSNILGSRIKIIATPNSIEDAKEFIQSIVDPIEIKDFRVEGNEIVVSAGKQNKAALIGRDKRRLEEMKKIVKNYFGKDYRIE